MTGDTISRQEFELYSHAQEKGNLADRLRISLPLNYVIAGLTGSAAVFRGFTGMYFLHKLTSTEVASEVLWTFANATVSAYYIRNILKKYKQIWKAEAELELIKVDPAYKRLDTLLDNG